MYQDLNLLNTFIHFISLSLSSRSLYKNKNRGMKISHLDRMKLEKMKGLVR